MQGWKVKLKSVRGFTTIFTTFYDRDIKRYEEIREIYNINFAYIVGYKKL